MRLIDSTGFLKVLCAVLILTLIACGGSGGGGGSSTTQGVDDSASTSAPAPLTVNGDGADHSWGSHHFLVGGAVKGGDIYGDIPVAQLGHEQDAGNGRLIPSLSVEQLAAPLGRWFGLNQDELNATLPNLSNFFTPSPEFI